MENIVVTGGAGFIGSNLCRTLLEKGEKVVIIDNFNNFYQPELKWKNISSIKSSLDGDSDAFKLYEADVRDIGVLRKIFSDSRVDCIVHLAACAGVRNSIENPALYTDVNVTGTINMLEMAREFGVSRFVFASSSSVYGNNNGVPSNEDDRVDLPVSPYAATKKAGELLCYSYHALYNISMACLRLFTVYGPGQRPDLAIHKFVKLIMEGREIPVYGDGSARRDYTYVDDIVDGTVKCIYWLAGAGRRYEIFNLGNSNPFSLLEMIETIEKVTGRKAVLKEMPHQLGDVKVTCADIGKAISVLGYGPKTGLLNGITRFFEWYRQTIMQDVIK